MGRPKRLFWGLGYALTALPAALAEDPFPGRMPPVDIGQHLPSGFEPSGALWHPGLERLLIVHDNGEIAAMDVNGDRVETWRCPGDLEAITMVDPDDEVVYVGVERPDGIKAFDLDEGEVIGSWDLTEWMRGPENMGLEALTFVPEEYLPRFLEYNDNEGSRYDAGGFFYAGLEDDGRIYVFDVDLDHSGVVSHVTTLAPTGHASISGLYFHESTGLLYALYNSVDRVLVMTTAGEVLHEWQMQRGYLEGITIRPVCDEDDDVEGIMVIAEDTGPVWRYHFYKADPDGDCDRVPDCRDICPGTPPDIYVDRNGCPARDPTRLDGTLRR
jgi:hypothetical protein